MVYDWTPSVTVYSNEGKVVSPARNLDFEPCSTSVSDLSFIISNKDKIK